MRIERVEAHVRDVLPTQSYLSAADVIVMHQQFCERALARTVGPHDRMYLAGLHVEVDAPQDLLVVDRSV